MGRFHLGFNPLMRIPVVSPDPLKRGEGSGPDREGGGPGRPNARPGLTKVYPTPPRPVETPDGTDGPPWEPGRLVFPSLDGPMVRRPGPFGSSRVYPPRWERGRPDGRDHIQSLSVHFQSTCGSTFSPRGPPRAVHIRLWHSTPDGVNHAELCDGHVEIHGPNVIRIKYGGSLGGGPDVSWGGLSNLPSGHSRRGIPCQRRPRPGEKLSGVSAFVGVKGEDIRTLRAKRPEASAVCRKAPGPRPHPVPVSHTQLHAIPMESTYTPHVLHVRGHAQSTYVEPRGPHGVQRRRG